MEELVNEVAGLEAAATNRLAVRDRVRLHRIRTNPAKYIRNYGREKFWLKNRTELTPDQLADLESRQTEFCLLAAKVQEIIDQLRPGVQIGPDRCIDYLVYPDVVYEDLKLWLEKTNPNDRVIHHPNDQQFANLHEDYSNNAKVLALFSSADPEWFKFGVYTRFDNDVWGKFLNVVGSYLDACPYDENFDPEIVKNILADRDALTPDREQRRQQIHACKLTVRADASIFDNYPVFRGEICGLTGRVYRA
jgi:hypothetical protein